ncbi:hypothetical protein C1I95_16985 [Micromonospora craterilacus]|uniref:Uncharacterized protein n=1 Tax=Micromonospora craterilacus TaxID=1655439 RepID=A0A2W2DY98_9ACTN|nr:hypothetical protein [Micromonospora craterilacus]PZG16722.1 hypothetical protein C1I95_16985 [Micromonospora craterilacus]
MPVEPAVIDLDEHDHRVAEPRTVTRTPRRTVVLLLLAVFTAGVVAGGLGMTEIRDSREQQERDATVALVALPASAHSGGGTPTGAVRLNGQLALINTGPSPITVRSARAQRPGVLIRDTGHTRTVRPGGTGWIDVELLLQCPSTFDPEPVPMTFAVETADGRVREVGYPIALATGSWADAVSLNCRRGI